MYVWFQVENGIKETNEQIGEQITDDHVGTEDDDDNVSEISGLSDISITGAGRWHPMKGLSDYVYFVFLLYL